MSPIMHAVISSLPRWNTQIFASPADIPPLALLPLGLCALLAIVLAVARRAGTRRSTEDRRATRPWPRAA